MIKMGIGCCSAIIGGCVGAIFMIVIIVIAIYFCFNSHAYENSVNEVETVWKHVKDDVEKNISKVTHKVKKIETDTVKGSQ